MRELYTEIIIEAPVEKVWKVLANFKDYPQWNPFIIEIEGDIQEGRSFKVRLQQPGSDTMLFRPICLRFDENKTFIWEGKLILKGIFDGKHIFELMPLGKDRTRFIQREEFRGLLVGLFWSKLDTQTRLGFERMNIELKKMVEKSSNSSSLTNN